MLTPGQEIILRRQNKATMAKCRGCIHLAKTEGGDYLICDYLWHTGQLRGCPIEKCDKKELGPPKRRRRGLSLSYNAKTVAVTLLALIMMALTIWLCPETEAADIDTPSVTVERDADFPCLRAREKTLARRTQRYAQPTGEWVYIGRYYITGYDICVACCGKTDGITASGVKAEVGRTVAAPSSFAFGTRLLIDGIGERIVEDRGGAIKGNKIDVLCNNHAECYAITGTFSVYVWKEG